MGKVYWAEGCGWSDSWTRVRGGGGVMRAECEDGRVWESGGGGFGRGLKQ